MAWVGRVKLHDRTSESHAGAEQIEWATPGTRDPRGRGRSGITSSGELVWSFINAWDDDEVGWILGAYKFPGTYADFTELPCAQREPAG
jgi:hypothetical protein